MTEKKEDKPTKKQDYEAIVRTRVETRAVSLGQTLYESVTKADVPNTDKKLNSQKVYLKEKAPCKKK